MLEPFKKDLCTIAKRAQRDGLCKHKSGKGDRVGFKVLEDGRKVRVFKSNGEELKS